MACQGPVAYACKKSFSHAYSIFGNNGHARIRGLALVYAYANASDEATTEVHASHRINPTPAVHTHFLTHFPTVPLPPGTSLSSSPQPPFEAVPSTRGARGGEGARGGGARGGGGKRRGGSGGEGIRDNAGGGEAGEVKQGKYSLQGKNHGWGLRRGGHRDCLPADCFFQCLRRHLRHE